MTQFYLLLTFIHKWNQAYRPLTPTAEHRSTLAGTHISYTIEINTIQIKIYIAPNSLIKRDRGAGGQLGGKQVSFKFAFKWVGG